jgi:hopanoid C-3 methylase
VSLGLLVLLGLDVLRPGISKGLARGGSDGTGVDSRAERIHRLAYMFLGIEALDEQGLELFRKRVSPDTNMKALEVARRLGITVAINLIVDPGWDEKQFELVREFALSVPEIVHLTVITPYPGTEIWPAQSQKLTSYDYRLFDIQHAVLPTKLPLEQFYEELVRTQAVINRKFLGVAAIVQTFGIMARQLAHGQTNFLRMIWKFNSVYNPRRQYSDHLRDVRYELPRSQAHSIAPQDRTALYIHHRAAAHGGHA